MDRILLYRYPPSVNRLWRYTNRGVYRTQRYREYLDDCARLHPTTDPPFDAPVKVRIYAARPDKRIRDLDNLSKCLLDTLQHVGVITDDHLVHELHLTWDTKNEYVTNGVMVVVSPLVPPVTENL